MNSQLFQKIKLEYLWALLVIAGVFIFVNTQPIRPHDFWWHIAVGREIISSGMIPQADVYSYLMEGTPYASYQMYWLADLALYGLFQLGGPALVIFVQSILITTTYGLLLWICWKTSRNLRVAAFSILLAIALGINNWNVRPQVISYFIGVFFLLSIFNFRHNGKRAWLIILPIGMLIWVNSHGSFVIGLVLLAIWVADEFWHFIRNRFREVEDQSYSNLRISILSFAVTALVCLLNPRGFGIISYVLTLTGDPSVQNLVPEWAAPNLNDVYGILFFGVFMLSAVLLAISPRRPGFWELAVYVIFGLLALQTTRGVIWFGIVMAPVLAVHFTELGRILQRSTGHEGQRKGNPFVNWSFVGLILLIAIISLPWFKEYLPFPRNKAGLISAETPRKAVQHLVENDLNRELFHEMGFGSYLIWAAYPDYQVFVDPRIELFPFEIWEDYIALSNALPGWEERAGIYGIRTLLLNPDRQALLVAAAEASQNWILAYEDQSAVIFSKVDE